MSCLGLPFAVTCQMKVSSSRRPVPARSDREHGVEWPGGEVVLRDREEDQCPKLVKRSVVLKDLRRPLICKLECPGVIAGAGKAGADFVEFRDGGVGDLVRGRCRLRIDGLTVVLGVGGHGHHLRPHLRRRSARSRSAISPPSPRRSKGLRSRRSPSCRWTTPRAQADTPVAAPNANEPHPQLVLSW